MKTMVVITVAAALAVLYFSTQGQGADGYLITDSADTPILDLDGITTEIQSTMTLSPTDNPQNMSDAGRQMLQNLEGFSATPYPDHKGYSIGYGHLIKAGENLPTVSREQAAQLLANDLDWAETAVRKAVTENINQSQFDALCSFCYNVGAGAFAKSTLVKRINQRDPNCSDEFSRWIFASGQQNGALVNRRRTEIALFDSEGTFA